MGKKKIDWTAAVRRAKRERDRNTGRIEAGETFRAQKKPTRKGPS